MIVFSTRSSWCEKIIFLSISLISIILGLDYKFTILPFHGVFLIAYLFFIIISSTWITFICLQNLLQHDKPFEYDLEKSIVLQFALKLYNLLNNNSELQNSEEKSTIIKKVKESEPNGDTDKFEDKIDSKVFQPPLVTERCTKTIDERLEDLVRDTEVRFILKWYMHISEDPTFPSECKVLLDEIFRRFLQIVVEVDGRKLMYGCIVVFLKHVKEFRKTIKRSQKNDATVEELYRYSHIGSKSPKAMEHFIFHLTANILRQFINWELWNSLPCRSLVSILSRRFTTYILTYISSPGFLNYKIVQTCSSDTAKINLNLDKYYFISLSDVDHNGTLRQPRELDISCVDVKEKSIENLKNEDNSNTPIMSPRKITKKTTPDPVDGMEFDVVDSCRKSKRTENLELQNGTTAKPIDNIPGGIHTPVTKVETKFSESNKMDTHKAETRPKASEPVKIYESKSTKTWRNSSDLECISLGQDLLAFQEFTDPDSQIQELIEKKLWKDNGDPIDDEKSGSMWDIPESWYGEEEASDVPDEVTTSPTTNFQNYLKSTANTANTAIGNVTATTLHNMKELQQTTVNTVNTVVKPVSQATSNAMHKIGDLQDEAAGMVEGILDFGMAGLRKGLRLTGLQENFSELTQKAKNEFQKPDSHKPIEIHRPLDIHKPIEIHKPVDIHKPMDIHKPVKVAEAVKVTEPVKINGKDTKKYEDIKNHKSVAKLMKTPHVSSEEKPEQVVQSSSESDESVWINPLSKESPSFDGHILLEKTPDSLPMSIITEMQELKESMFSSPESEPKPFIREIPQITEDILLTEDSPDPEYEEPQDFATTIAKLRTLLQQKSSESGFTTPALSPLPHDEMAKTPSEPPPADLSKVDGAMPSLYKFCARTATGVFQNTINTIKTALPGNVSESNQDLVHCAVEDWTFVEADSTNDDFYTRMKKLLSERRAFCTVDTAYEAIDSLEVVDQPDSTWSAPTPQFDDEQDEFDLQVPITKALVDIACELIGDTNTCLLREPVVKAVLLLIGNYSEEYITRQSDSLLHNVNKFVGKLPENFNQDVMAMKLNEIVKICMDAFPSPMMKLLGESTIETGIHLFLTSLQSQRINQDIFMQMFELFASELISACSQASPAYSA